jgi:hypothetical protein
MTLNIEPSKVGVVIEILNCEIFIISSDLSCNA